MKKVQLRQINKLPFTVLLLGLMVILVQSNFAQDDRSPSGAFKKMGHKKIKQPKRPVPGEMGGLLGVNSKNRNKGKCEGKIEVTIAGHPSFVRIGQEYSFVALTKGGCRGTYKYQWSGTNLNTGSGKRTGLLPRNYMTASFKNPGTSTISVVVVDERNNRDSDRIVLKVLPKK
jgi:hypothetical protein